MLEEGRLVWEKKVKQVEEIVDVHEKHHGSRLSYNSNPEDCLWASGGMVARVVQEILHYLYNKGWMMQGLQMLL